MGTRYLDIIFTSFFVVEMLMKIASLTFVEYIKDPWNMLDCLIATTSFLSLLSYMGLGAIWLLGSMGAMSSNSSVRARFVSKSHCDCLDYYGPQEKCVIRGIWWPTLEHTIHIGTWV